MTLAQVSQLTENTLVPVGLVITIIGCTWWLASKSSGIISTIKGLLVSIDTLTSTFHNHVTESDNRDRDHRDTHHQLRTLCSSNVEAIKGANQRLDRVEKQSDLTDARVDVHDKSITVLEARLK